MNINDYMTPNEASFRWGIPQETLKARLKPSRNKEQIESMESEGLIKSFKRPNQKRNEWIITREAMEKWYGKENKKL